MPAWASCFPPSVRITIFPLFAPKHSSVDSDQHITAIRSTTSCNQRSEQQHRLWISLRESISETELFYIGVWCCHNDVDDCQCGEISFSTFTTSELRSCAPPWVEAEGGSKHHNGLLSSWAEMITMFVLISSLPWPSLVTSVWKFWTGLFWLGFLGERCWVAWFSLSSVFCVEPYCGSCF